MAAEWNESRVAAEYKRWARGARWNESRAAAEYKRWTRRAKWSESRAEEEYKFGNRQWMEPEYGRRWSNHNQERHE